MRLSIELNEADAALFQRYADTSNCTISEAILTTMRKAAHNAEYLAMLDKSMQEFNDGKYVAKSTEELEKLFHG